MIFFELRGRREKVGSFSAQPLSPLPAHFARYRSAPRDTAHTLPSSAQRNQELQKKEKSSKQRTLASPSMFIVPRKEVLIVLIGLYL
jgi:hypothetical protein